MRAAFGPCKIPLIGRWLGPFAARLLPTSNFSGRCLFTSCRGCCCCCCRIEAACIFYSELRGSAACDFFASIGFEIFDLIEKNFNFTALTSQVVSYYTYRTMVGFGVIKLLSKFKSTCNRTQSFLLIIKSAVITIYNFSKKTTTI